MLLSKRESKATKLLSRFLQILFVLLELITNIIINNILLSFNIFYISNSKIIRNYRKCNFDILYNIMSKFIDLLKYYNILNSLITKIIATINNNIINY